MARRRRQKALAASPESPVALWRRDVFYAPVWLWAILGVTLIAAVWRRKDIATTLTLLTRWAHPTNYGSRNGTRIDTIVIHTTEGSLASAASWFAMDHAPSGLGVSSAHYIIGKDGSVILSVDPSNAAYHASDAAMNRRSIGIELEGAAADPTTFTPAMLRALVALGRTLASKYAVPLRRGVPGIIGHLDVPAAAAKGKVDPGPYFPWASFLSQVGAGAVA